MIRRREDNIYPRRQQKHHARRDGLFFGSTTPNFRLRNMLREVFSSGSEQMMVRLVKPLILA